MIRIFLRTYSLIIFFVAALLAPLQVYAKSLTVACYKDYRPYSYVNDKAETVGLLVDIWQLWAEKNRVELTFIPDHLSQCLERIKSGEADFMIGLFRSEERAQFLDFSTPFLNVQTNVYVTQKSGIDALDELGSTAVGVIENDFVVGYLGQHHPDIRIRTFPGSSQLVKQALAGKLTAYALDFPNAIFLMAEHDSLVKFKRIEQLYTERLRAGVKKGNTQLLNRLNKGIKAFTHTDRDTVLSKWGLPKTPLMVRYREWIIGTVILLAAGCIGVAGYAVRLKSRIRRLRTGDLPFDESQWKAMIRQGETEQTEFKSSLRWNLKTQKTDKILEMVVIKTLSAYMNTNGGTLFIGVDDQGDILGIEPDYATFQKKPDRDGFMLKLSGLIGQHLGRQSHKFISTDIQVLDGRDICRITVVPGERPVFITEKGKEFFYIRAGASSVPLSMSEAHEYISSHW